MSLATVSNTPAIIVVTGANVTERKLAIVASAGSYAAMALSAEKGKVGKAAQARTGHHGMAGVAVVWHLANCDNATSEQRSTTRHLRCCRPAP